MNQEFSELIDQLESEVSRLRKEVVRLRQENAKLSSATAGPLNGLDELDKHALRHQVIEHIRKIDHILGESA